MDSELFDRYLDEALAGRDEPPADFLRRHGRSDPSLEAALGELRRLAGPGRDPEGLPFARLGGFELVRRLGGGGMGEVFLAAEQGSGRFVALKVIRAEHRDTPRAAERFLREARALSKLRHPAIVSILASGEERGVLYLAMELVPGKGLDELVAEGPLPVPRVVEWGIALARGLAAAHAQGVLHRDVKPSNVRIAADGRPVLIDFGLARDTEANLPTITTRFVGSPAYASPEQITAPSRALDGRTDVYGLAVTLHECLAGRRPFDGDDPTEVVGRILTQPPPPLRGVPAEVERVVLRALAKAPSDRHPTADAFADDLAAAVRPRAPRRRLAPRAAVAAALVSLAIVAGVAIRQAATSAGPTMEHLPDGRVRIDYDFSDPAQLDDFAAEGLEAKLLPGGGVELAGDGIWRTHARYADPAIEIDFDEAEPATRQSILLVPGVRCDFLTAGRSTALWLHGEAGDLLAMRDVRHDAPGRTLRLERTAAGVAVAYAGSPRLAAGPTGEPSGSPGCAIRGTFVVRRLRIEGRPEESIAK